MTRSSAHDSRLAVHEANLLPGITFPAKDGASYESRLNGLPTRVDPPTFSGPMVDGEVTKVTLFAPHQLLGSTLLPSLRSVINNSFAKSHAAYAVLPLNILRLQTEDQFLDELSNAPGTFTYIIHRRDGHTVLATATSKRYSGPVEVVDSSYTTRHQTFTRKVQPDADCQEWELNLMAVDTNFQRQGLAGYMMQLIEDEIKRRSREATDKPEKVKMLLTTIKEINERFYARRGFVKDDETWHEAGYLGSPSGFTIIHMSRSLVP